MSNKKNELILLSISIACFFVMSFVFVPKMPQNLADMSDHNILSGIIFWSFLLLGIFTQVLLANRRRDWLVKNKMQRNTFRKKRIGLLSFAQNPPAIIADVIFILSVIAFGIAMYLTNGKGDICSIFMAIFIFSFCMHCIFNGKIYDYITKQDKISKSGKGVKEND